MHACVGNQPKSNLQISPGFERRKGEREVKKNSYRIDHSGQETGLWFTSPECLQSCNALATEAHMNLIRIRKMSCVKDCLQRCSNNVTTHDHWNPVSSEPGRRYKSKLPVSRLMMLITVATTNRHQRIPVTIVPNMNLLKFLAHFNSELMEFNNQYSNLSTACLHWRWKIGTGY